ncbi:hypothetical protein Tco_1306222 [Tanacetum coccineum]
MRHSMRMLVKHSRSQDGIDDKDNDKGSKSRSQSMKEQAYNKEQRERPRPRPHELNDKSNLIDLMKELKCYTGSYSTQFSTANLSDVTIYAFLANQPNGSQLVHEDLEQIHEDDLEEMDLKGPRNQDNKSRNQDSLRRTINVEETSSKAMLAIDGAGFDWSFMANEEVSTDTALMDFSDSEFNKSEFNLATYKRGLASVEEQLVFNKKNEVIFYE